MSDHNVDLDAPRFYIEHGRIHDRETGKHVTTDPDGPFDSSVTECCALLNALARRPVTGGEDAEKLIAEARRFAADPEESPASEAIVTRLADALEAALRVPVKDDDAERSHANADRSGLPDGGEATAVVVNAIIQRVCDLPGDYADDDPEVCRVSVNDLSAILTDEIGSAAFGAYCDGIDDAQANEAAALRAAAPAPATWDETDVGDVRFGALQCEGSEVGARLTLIADRMARAVPGLTDETANFDAWYERQFSDGSSPFFRAIQAYSMHPEALKRAARVVWAAASTPTEKPQVTRGSDERAARSEASPLLDAVIGLAKPRSSDPADVADFIVWQSRCPAWPSMQRIGKARAAGDDSVRHMDRFYATAGGGWGYGGTTPRSELFVVEPQDFGTPEAFRAALLASVREPQADEAQRSANTSSTDDPASSVQTTAQKGEGT